MIYKLNPGYGVGEGGASGIRFQKDGKATKAHRVPYSVIEKLEMGFPYVEFEKPEKTCRMCDDAPTHQRYLNQVMVELCAGHYYNSSLGAIAQYLREHKGDEDGANAKVSTTSPAKRRKRSRIKREAARQNA